MENPLNVKAVAGFSQDIAGRGRLAKPPLRCRELGEPMSCSVPGHPTEPGQERRFDLTSGTSFKNLVLTRI